ncbi:hypothetical protein RB195_023177 [Necator americanus]|uniref:Uncharacterized protein n=1 Tax=Necator americanus TaxID=51031 RepID=A0ABR1EJ35_NECAM
MEVFMRTSNKQGVSNRRMKILRELYKDFIIKILPFYNNNTINMKRERVQQGDTVSSKIFSATFKNVMQGLKWDDMSDGQQHYLRLADGIILITPSINQAERVLVEFDEKLKRLVSR